MNEMLASPGFGLANLTNCERELIHFPGSIQPFGFLLVLAETDLTVLQASENLVEMIGVPASKALTLPAGRLGGDLAPQVTAILEATDAAEPKPLRCMVGEGGYCRQFEGTVHRHPGGGIIVELEPVLAALPANTGAPASAAGLQQFLADAINHFSGALSARALADEVVRCFRDMTGYDRVMVYKFDPDGHGEIIAEACHDRLDSLLGHHYPATDIPQRARDLYIRNRVRVLVDVDYTPVPLVPRLHADTREELDMSLCYLRSMSPLHLQYLKNMGVTGTLVVSLVRDGRLWGLVACHHYSALQLPYGLRVASGLLGEVVSTRIAAIENYTQAQLEIQLRRLELRLIEATSTDGDWRLALFSNPLTLLQPLEATGAALFFDGEVMTVGDVPAPASLRILAQWISAQRFDSIFECSSIARLNPAFAEMAPVASGVLAVELSPSGGDYLMWFRKEQVSEMTWAGNPAKPMLDNDPMNLSPRRSFAAWLEIVRGTATRWSIAEVALARAIGATLTDIILQIQAVRLLIVKKQLEQVRAQVVNSKEPVVIADVAGKVLFANQAFTSLLPTPDIQLADLRGLAKLFVDEANVHQVLDTLCTAGTPWRGEWRLLQKERSPLPVGVRLDSVLGHNEETLGFIMMVTDITHRKKAELGRSRFEDSIAEIGRMAGRAGAGARSGERDVVMDALLANSKMAGIEIADAASESVSPLLEEIEASTRRAADLYKQLQRLKDR